MDTTDALLAFLVAAAVTLALTPQAARLARRVGAVAQPRERDLHDRPTPRLGGIAIPGGVLVSGILFLPTGEETRGILIGACVITAVGALDDTLDLAAPIKLVGQIAAAFVPVQAHVRVENFTLPFIGAVDLGPVGGAALTLLG